MPQRPRFAAEWLPLLPLALIPATGAFPAYQTVVRAALLAAALILALWLWMMASNTRIEACALANGSVGRWELLLLAIVIAAATAYLMAAARQWDITFNDGAYYYGVARHMARTGRFEEPIVWHFLSPPAAVSHAPFDYWGCMTSLLLVPPLMIFGATPTTAFITMSVIASLSALAFWYLVCVALPLRYCATQLVALTLFAFSPAMDVWRIQPESIPVIQLFILLALIAFCRGRSVTAVLCGFCVLLTRGDGLILFLVILLTTIYREWTNRDDDPRRWRWVVATGVACLTVYAVWSLMSFGTITPPAPQILPFLEAYNGVFDFGVQHERSLQHIVHWFTGAYVRARVAMAVDAWRAIPFVPMQDWWLAIALVPAINLFRSRALCGSLVWLLCFPGYFVVAWVTGPGFAPGRTPYTFTPLIVLTGALGLDTALIWTDTRTTWGMATSPARLLLGASVLALTFLLLVQLPVLKTPYRFPNLPVRLQVTLKKLDPILHGEALASNIPWYLIAYTDSPSISVPINGEAAIDAAFAQYDIRWLVLFDFPFKLARGKPGMFGASRPVFEGVLDGTRTRIGRFKLSPISIPGVYHLERTHSVESSSF